MINAAVFDLDGTLVQTERLKAISYAKAVVELCPNVACEELIDPRWIVDEPARLGEIVEQIIDEAAESSKNGGHHADRNDRSREDGSKHEPSPASRRS